MRKCSAKLQVRRMDVTIREEVERVVEEIRCSGRPLWALVNNAGIVIDAFLDWGEDVSEYSRILEVNLLGLIRVTKCCLPLLRESGGRIVNVSSAAGE